MNRIQGAHGFNRIVSLHVFDNAIVDIDDFAGHHNSIETVECATSLERRQLSARDRAPNPPICFNDGQ